MNARTPISGNLPVEAALALYDAAGKELNIKSFMGAARDSLIEDLMAGKQVGYQKFWLRSVLDSAIDRNYLGEIHSLAEMFSGLDSVRGDDASDRLEDLRTYINALVTHFVDDNAKLVQDRAEKMAEEASDAAEESAREEA